MKMFKPLINMANLEIVMVLIELRDARGVDLLVIQELIQELLFI